MRRERSFSVAAVAEAAADGEDLPGTPGGSPAGRTRRTDKGDHIAAFSTPLKGATTPARPGQTKPRLSMGGADAEPLPKRFVRDALTLRKETPTNGRRSVDPSPNGGPSSSSSTSPDPAVVNSLRVFFAKVMRLSARRLADLCERLAPGGADATELRARRARPVRAHLAAVQQAPGPSLAVRGVRRVQGEQGYAAEGPHGSLSGDYIPVREAAAVPRGGFLDRDLNADGPGAGGEAAGRHHRVLQQGVRPGD